MIPPVKFIRPLSFGFGVESWLALLGGQKVVLRRFFGPALDPGYRLLPDEFTLFRISHPGIQRLLLSGNDDDGAIVYIYEFIEGRSLYDIMRDDARTAIDGSLLATMLRDGLEALSCLHEESPVAPVLHGDVSPGNMVWGSATPGGPSRLTLIDVRGIDAPGNRDQADDAPDDIIVGTLPYIADEVLGGKMLTPAAETWSLAASLLSAALGGSPWRKAASPAEMLRMRSDLRPEVLLNDAAGIAGLDDATLRTLAAMLSTDPSDRPSASEAIRMLS